jgi:hypothetical protein
MINIRLATVADHAGIWGMLEPVFRAGETQTLPQRMRIRESWVLGDLAGLDAILRSNATV